MTEHVLFESIHPVYRDGLQAALQSCWHEDTLETEPGLELVQVSAQNISLMVLFNPAVQVIQKAAHRGARSDTHRALMEALCDILVGMTIQEASDHAGIYLEYRLRDHTQKAPIPGIVTPENAEPAFGIAVQLTRQLLAKYREATGYTSIENCFDSQPSPAWLCLTADEKICQLKETLTELCSDLGMQESDIEVIQIDDNVKVTIQFRCQLASAAKQRCLMQLEAGLKQKVENKLQLYMQELKDLNAIRRL